LADFVSADTSVVALLSKPSAESRAYDAVIGSALIAISFQVLPELLSAQFSPARQARLEAYLDDVVVLPHSSAADARFAIASRKRGELRRKQNPGSDASDADVWIIASALEHSLPLLSHDRQQVELGRALGLEVWTNLPRLRDANPAIR
jgi:predicted nucleic acid-binding protein